MKDKILLLVSTGLGNVLNAMLLYKTLQQKYDVEVAMNEPFLGLHKLFKAKIYPYTSYPNIDVSKYVGKVETLWGKDSRIRIPVLNKPQNITKLYEEGVSEIEYSVRIAEELGIPRDKFIFDLDLDYDDNVISYDIILANTTKNFKEWEWKRYPYYKELAEILKQKYRICSIGSKEEYIKGTVNETGKSILTTAGIIKHSRLVITNDSGIYHLANALKVKNICILCGSVFNKIYDKRFHKHTYFVYNKLNRTKENIKAKELREIKPEDISTVANSIIKELKVLMAFPSNSQERLNKTLDSIFTSKNRHKLDVFVLDDATEKPLTSKYKIFMERRDIPAKGHFGILKTDLLDRILKLDYDIFYLCDDDCKYYDGWLDKAIEMLKYPKVGISTIFCHPIDWKNYKETTKGIHYFPHSTAGCSFCIKKDDLYKIYNKYKDILRSKRGSWDYILTKSIFGFGKIIISTIDSWIQHNPWEIEGFYKRKQIKGLKFKGDKKPNKKVSIIILCHNQIQFTKRCIESIRKFTKIPYQLIVVDNNSIDGTDKFIIKNLNKGDIYIRDLTDFNFSYFNNKAAKIADGEYIFIMNNDVEVMEDNWLGKMLEQKADADAIGTSICYDVVNEDKKQIYYNGKRKTEWPYLEGWGILISKELFLNIGGFDGDTFNPIYAEDADLSFRLKKLGKKIKEAKIRVVHYHNQTTKHTDLRSFCNPNAIKLYNKHFDRKYQFNYIYNKIKNVGVGFWTDLEDLYFLLDLVYSLGGGERIIDIGTAYGETAFSMALLKPRNSVITIDTYKSKEVNWENYHLNFRRVMKLKLNNIVLIQKSSSDFVNEFDGDIGFLWIDGDHSYEAVKKDIELWGNKLLPNHIICGHDFGGNEIGVNKAVEEIIIGGKNFKEFRTSPNRNIWVARRV